MLRELADGKARAVDGERRDDGVDTAPIRESCVDVGTLRVDVPVERRDDGVYDSAYLLVGVEELLVDALQPSLALDIDVLVAVDHDFGHGLVIEESLQRAEVQEVVDGRLGQRRPRVGVDSFGKARHLLVDDARDYPLHGGVVESAVNVTYPCRELLLDDIVHRTQEFLHVGLSQGHTLSLLCPLVLRGRRCRVQDERERAVLLRLPDGDCVRLVHGERDRRVGRGGRGHRGIKREHLDVRDDHLCRRDAG